MKFALALSLWVALGLGNGAGVVSGAIDLGELGASLQRLKLSELLSKESLEASVGLLRGALDRARARDTAAESGSILDLFNVDGDLSNDDLAAETSARVQDVVLPEALRNLAGRVERLGSQVAATSRGQNLTGINRALVFMQRAIETGRDPEKVLAYLRSINAPKVLQDIRSNNVALERLGQGADRLVGVARSVQSLLGNEEGRNRLVQAVEKGLKDALDRGAEALDSDDAEPVPAPGGASKRDRQSSLRNSFFGFLRAGFNALQNAFESKASIAGRERKASSEETEDRPRTDLNRLFFT